ncbi:MAG: hypothetical protein LLG04_18155 [Parachlamydia sp.]|nr:hypothetical protein [Parachlamydia sp.]
MKKFSKTLQVYTPQEFDIGNLIRDDELFAIARHRLRPEIYLQDELQRLVKVMIEVGNKIEEIVKVDRVLAVYAMTLCNHVLNWTLKSKCKDLEEL